MIYFTLKLNVLDSMSEKSSVCIFAISVTIREIHLVMKIMWYY